MGSMKKILVVEDDQSTADILELRLCAAGYDPVIARDGKYGWHFAKSEKPDLVIMDVGLPMIDGFSLCDMIKKDKDLKDTPVIMLTAKNTVGDWEDGFSAGADAYLNKPYVWDRLLLKIKELLGA
jgi:DNA-binding response OmpR family regulator